LGVSENSSISCSTSCPRQFHSISPKLGNAGSVQISFQSPLASRFQV
jgi:hypothetical protein